MTIRTLVLSGGGGRGAFHAGVYTFLRQSGFAWEPDILVGTSIGAVNGAAIAQGVSAEALERFWLGLREHHIQGLPPGMRVLTRWVVNQILDRLIGVKLAQTPAAYATSPPAEESWPPLPVVPFLNAQLVGRWNNLLDTGPLRRTLTHTLKLEAEKIAASDKILIINATNVRTGEQAIFANRGIADRRTGIPRDDVQVGIDINRILASCSIPLVYPWTQDHDGEVYWDGAVVANTPLGATFDACITVGRPIEEPMEIVVVMMTPWWEVGEAVPAGRQHLPRDFGEAITWTLDWALLASFRERLEMTRLCNRIAARQREEGREVTYRHVDVIIVAPEDFLPVERIIDYDEPASRWLIELGYNAAERAFQRHFGKR